jgi:hypothetical protein
MSNIGNYFSALTTKLGTCTYITDSNNIIIGESVDIAGLKSSYFPRLEILITKDKGDGYESQRRMRFQFRYSIAGYIMRNSQSVTITDVVNIMNFALNVRALNYNFLDDKQSGNPPCSGFDSLGAFPECFYEWELFGPVSAFILEIEANINTIDTEVL